MYNKELKFKAEARQKMLKGINLLADAVGSTLGPQGNCVIITDLQGNPRVTKDGVSVAREIQLADPFENAGAQLVKEAAVKTLNTVGDSTTTSTILARKLIEGINSALNSGYSANVLREDLSKGVKTVLEYIDDNTIQVKDSDIKNIATISSNNDEELGELIQDTFLKIGRNGIITVEESFTEKTTAEVIQGMQFDRGYVANHFVTDPIKDTCILENPYILITEHKINRMKDIGFILNQIVNEGRSLLIIAEDYDDEVVETLKLNKLNGTLKVCIIKAPSFGEYRHYVLDDIAALTNGFNLSYDSGKEVINTSMKDLGTCQRVVVTKNTTTIIGGKGDVSERVEIIKNTLEKLKSDSTKDGSFLIKFNEERLAKLTAGISVIYAGGITDLERGERKDRIEDAVAATKVAIEDGVVLGGGLTYHNAIAVLPDNKSKGISILKEALNTPITVLVESAGETMSVVGPCLTATKGFDAKTNEIVDMYEAGIIDPTKAVKLALENAFSVANLFLSTQCVIVPIPMI